MSPVVDWSLRGTQQELVEKFIHIQSVLEEFLHRKLLAGEYIPGLALGSEVFIVAVL